MQSLRADISIKTVAKWEIQRLAKEYVEDVEAPTAFLMDMKVRRRRWSPWKSLNASGKAF